MNKIISYARFLMLVCTLIIGFGAFKPCLAKELNKEIVSDSILTNHTANSVLQYLGNGRWKEISNIDLSNYKEISLDNFNKESDGSYSQILPNISTNMVVLYDNWGELIRVLYPSGKDKIDFNNSIQNINKNFSIEKNALAQGKRKAKGTYKYGTVVSETKKKFGYTCNKITIGQSSVTGTGDFTVFTDKTGDHDNNLVKGDCATKGSIDNPSKNTRISVTNKTNGVTAVFKKNDNGSLPNAIIDIWKTGVEKLGINSKNYDDIKKAGQYKYNF